MKEDLVEYEKQLSRLMLFVDLPKQVGLGSKSVKENYIQPYYDSTYLDKEIRISNLKRKIVNLRKELGMNTNIELYVEYKNSTFPRSPDEVIKYLADELVVNMTNTYSNSTVPNSTINNFTQFSNELNGNINPLSMRHLNGSIVDSRLSPETNLGNINEVNIITNKIKQGLQNFQSNNEKFLNKEYEDNNHNIPDI